MSTTKRVTKADILEMAKSLSVEERCELIDDLGATISPIPEGMTREEFTAELDRRWQDHLANPSAARPVEEFIQELRRKHCGHG